jgi:hypothetical protein
VFPVPIREEEMKPLMILVLLWMLFVSAYASQVNYSNLTIITWDDLVGVDYTILSEEPEITVIMVDGVPYGIEVKTSNKQCSN